MLAPAVGDSDSFKQEEEDETSTPSQYLPRQPPLDSGWEERFTWRLREHEARMEAIMLKHLGGYSLLAQAQCQEPASRLCAAGEDAKPRGPRPGPSGSVGLSPSPRVPSLALQEAPATLAVPAPSSMPSLGADEDAEDLETRAEAAKKQQEEGMKKLKQVFVVAEQDEKLQAERRAKHYWQRFREMPTHDKGYLLDLIMCVIICINMVVIGSSIDREPTAVMLALDGALSACFLVEVIFKIWLFGVSGHYCPKDLWGKLGNFFDTVLVAIDIAQFCVQIIEIRPVTESTSEVRTSLLRVLRLIRLVRIVRILRLNMFHDLILMISGMLSGMPTLLWAIVLFIITIYVVALVCRVALGDAGEFGTMADSLLTVFRCSFGDCTTWRGATLLGNVSDSYGAFAAAFLALFIFFVTIGLFNVISAIFVEATLSAKLKAERQTSRQRLNDFTLFATNMKILIERVSRESIGVGKASQPPRRDLTSENFSTWSRTEVDTKEFKNACMQDEQVMHALLDLDIHEGDFPELADILDPQNDGQISLHDILMGITRLRGEPRRSDIVNVDLMIRDVQLTVGKIRAMMTELVRIMPIQHV